MQSSVEGGQASAPVRVGLSAVKRRGRPGESSSEGGAKCSQA